MKNLRDELINKNKFLNKLIPKPISNYMVKVTNSLIEKGYNTKPLKVGDKLPDGKLINHNGDEINIKNSIENKAIILSFYRGAWCPYCNLELGFYDELLGEEKNSHISMIAISPEKPDTTLKKIDIDKLNFLVLSDQSNHYAKKLNLVFELPKKLVFIYRLMGINLKKTQKNDVNELPIPATYIVNSKGVISHAWIDADYTKRAEPEEVIAAYNNVV